MKPSLCWNMSELRALCKAIIYFERSLQALLPSHRASGNRYCKQNYSENPDLRSLDIGRCFDAINGMRGLDELKSVMNADGAGDYTRYYAWNFTNLKFNQQSRKIDGTVEYRNPPYANDARTCTAWMTLATTFASASRKAAREDAKIRREFGQDLRGLMSFLEYGSESWTRKADYLSLFPREASASSRSSAGRARVVEPSSSRTGAPRVEVRRSRHGEVRLERRT